MSGCSPTDIDTVEEAGVAARPVSASGCSPGGSDSFEETVRSFIQLVYSVTFEKGERWNSDYLLLFKPNTAGITFALSYLLLKQIEQGLGRALDPCANVCHDL